MTEGWFEEAGEAQPVVATIVAHLAGQVRIGRRFPNGGDFAGVDTVSTAERLPNKAAGAMISRAASHKLILHFTMKEPQPPATLHPARAAQQSWTLYS